VLHLETCLILSLRKARMGSARVAGELSSELTWSKR